MNPGGVGSLPPACRVSRSRGRNIFLLSLFFVAVASPAWANAGLPMIVLTFPAMLVALLPIILIEAAIYMKTLQVRFREGVIPSLVANLASAVAGVPVAWALLLGVELLATGGRALGIGTTLGKAVAVTVQAAWLIPYEEEFWWMVPTAAVVGLIPAYFLSVLIEYQVAKRFFRGLERKMISQAVWRGNTVTYLGVALAFALYLSSLSR